jgi:hypothetical protein
VSWLYCHTIAHTVQSKAAETCLRNEEIPKTFNYRNCSDQTVKNVATGCRHGGQFVE